MRWAELSEGPGAGGWQGVKEVGGCGFDRELAWFEVLARHGLDRRWHPVLAIGDAEGPAPVLALARSGRRLRALANFYTACFEPLMNGADVAALTGLLRQLRQGGEVSRLELRPMARESAVYRQLLEALRQAGWYTHEYFCHGNWYLPVEGRRFDDYREGLPGAVRSTLSRKGRKFTAAGGRLAILDGPAHGTAAVDAFQAVYASSWKRPEPFPEFMPSLIRLMATTGRMRMGVAMLDGAAIAAQFWIVDRGVASIYKLAYDEAQARWSAGSLLTAELMRHVIDVDRVGEVDYLIGDEPYKQDWMSHRRERWGVLAFNPASVDGAAGWLVESARRIARGWLPRR